MCINLKSNPIVRHGCCRADPQPSDLRAVTPGQQGETRSSGPFLKLRHPFSTACNVGRSSDFRNGPHGPAGSGPEHTFSKSLGQEAVARMAHLAVDVYRSQERTRGRLLSTALRFPRRSFTLPSKVIAIFAYRRQQAGARSSQQQPLDLIFYFYHFYPRAAARGMARGGAAAIHY